MLKFLGCLLVALGAVLSIPMEMTTTRPEATTEDTSGRLLSLPDPVKCAQSEYCHQVITSIIHTILICNPWSMDHKKSNHAIDSGNLPKWFDVVARKYVTLVKACGWPGKKTKKWFQNSERENASISDSKDVPWILHWTIGARKWPNGHKVHWNVFAEIM